MKTRMCLGMCVISKHHFYSVVAASVCITKHYNRTPTNKELDHSVCVIWKASPRSTRKSCVLFMNRDRLSGIYGLGDIVSFYDIFRSRKDRVTE